MINQVSSFLDGIMGDRESFSLDQRLFHFHAFLACLFCFLEIITNRLLGLAWTIDVVVAIIGLVFAVIYWFSRAGYGRSDCIKFGQCIVIASLIPVLWLFNGGVVGSLSLVSLTLVQYFTVVLRPAWLGLLFHVVVVSFCFVLEWFFPAWITPYNTPFSQKMDMYFTLSFLGFITFGNCYALLEENKIERQKLVLKIQELEDYRNQLENTNRILTKAQEISKLGVWELDLQDYKTTWSDQLYVIFDRDPSLGELSYEKFREKVHPEDWQVLEPLIDRAIKEGIPYEIEKRIILSNELTITLFGKTEAIRDKNGKIVRLFGVVQDITDRKRMENELRRNQVILTIAQRLAKVGYWEFEPETNRIEWSEQTFYIMGFEPATKAPTLFEIEQRLHPDDRELHTKALTLAIRQGISYRLELRLLLPDHSIRYIEVISEIEKENHKVVKIYGSVLDITDRKLAEAALRNSEEKYRLILAHQTEYVMQSKPDTTITFVNQAMGRAFSNDPDKIIGLRWQDFVPADELEALLAKINALTVENPTFININPDRRTDGTIGWTEWVNLGVFDTSGKLIEIQSVGRDITDRKKMEEELKESEARFRTLAANIPGVILRYILYPDGRDDILYISPGSKDLWGISPEEALADVKSLWQRCVPDGLPSLQESVLLSAQNLTFWKRDWRILTIDGQLKWVSGVGTPTRQEDGSVIWDTIITDVTDRKRSQSELEFLIDQRTSALQTSQKLLEEQLKREQHLFSVLQTELKQKDTLLKEVHHRVKNNLQIISSLMRLQVDNHEDPLLKASFQESQNRIQSMALIHERLYRSDDLSQIDTQIYFKELTDYLCQTYNANSQNIQVILNTPAILLEIDKAIPCGLIVNELFTNSLKYAFKNRPGGTITLICQQLDQGYNLQIRDTGIGLPPDFDLKGSRSLGLRLVNRLVKQLRGTIKIEYDGGTVFVINFPL